MKIKLSYLLAGLWSGLMLHSPLAIAAPPPPWLAVVEGEQLAFADSCATAAQQALREQGFARVEIQGDMVFGAYREGADYHYKAAIKCLPAYELVTITIATNRKGGLDQAKQLLAQLRQYATPTSGGLKRQSSHFDQAEATASALFPNCSDGPTLVRCLNTVPQDSIEIARSYLQKLKK